LEPDDTPLGEWLVEQMLPKRGTSLISGQWGTYKTFVALDLAASVMTRSAFAGRAVNPRRGAVRGGGGHDEVRVRLAALIQETVPAEAVDVAVRRQPFGHAFRVGRDVSQAHGQRCIAEIAEDSRRCRKGMKERFGLPLVAMEIDTLSPAAGFKDANDTAKIKRS
jgi:hypothetical protein